MALSFSLSLQAVAKADEAANSAESAASPYNLYSVQAGATAAFQGGGSSISFVARYMPEYRFSGGDFMSKLGAGIDFGVTAFNNAGDSAFLAIEYGAFASYHQDNLECRLLLGGQRWGSVIGSTFFTGIEPLYYFPKDTLPLIDAVFVSYEVLFFSNTAHEISAGVQIKF